MSTTYDRFDKAREQYISYNLYLERRQGNGYYNLGYQIFAAMWANPTASSAAPPKPSVSERPVISN